MIGCHLVYVYEVAGKTLTTEETRSAAIIAQTSASMAAFAREPYSRSRNSQWTVSKTK